MEWNNESSFENIEKQVKFMVNQVSRRFQTDHDTEALLEQYHSHDDHHDKNQEMVVPYMSVKSKGTMTVEASKDRGYNHLLFDSEVKSNGKPSKKPCKRRRLKHQHDATNSNPYQQTCIGSKISKEKKRLQLEIRKRCKIFKQDVI